MLPFTARQVGMFFIVLILAGTHYGAYRVGRALVAGDWAHEREVRANDMLELAKAHRAEKAELTRKANDVDTKYQASKKRAAADAVAADDELRLLEAALADARGESTTAPGGGADGASEGGLLLACATEHQGMAAEADATAVKLTSLQSYVRDVCKPNFGNADLGHAGKP